MFGRKSKEDQLLKNAIQTEAEKLLREKQIEVQNLSARIDTLESELRDSKINLTSLKRQIDGSKKASLEAALNENKKLWLEAGVLPIPKDITYIEDPIYKQVSLEPALASIYFHPIVQRLGHIKQLSFSHLTFPSATHTRLSHSLGVCRNAELALGTMLRKGDLYTPEAIEKIDLNEADKSKLILKAKAAGLLHDLGHGPFGHGLDQYMSSMMGQKMERGKKIQVTAYDKEFSAKYISKHLRADEIDLEGICNIFSTDETNLDGYDVLIKNIIDSPQDVDRMDYLIRDAHMTGLSLGVNIQAIIDRMLPFKKITEGRQTISLVFHPSAISHITNLLYARDSMYMNCYEHPNKVVAEKMLVRAIDEFRTKYNLNIDDIVFLSDEQLLRLLLEFSEPSDLSYQYALALLRNTLFEEVFCIHPNKWEVWDRKKGGKKADRENEVPPMKPTKVIESWEDEGLFYKVRFISRPREWEESIAANVGLKEDEKWKILITVPSANMFEARFDRIRILVEEGSGKYSYRKLGEITDYWEGILKYLGNERYAIRVFVSADLSMDKKRAIYEEARKLFVEEVN